MAKVSGPLMSVDASGTYANALTFSKSLGRNIVRLRVIPRNPRSVLQLAVRSVLGTMAKSIKVVLTNVTDPVGVGSELFVAAKAIVPAGQTWVSYLQKVVYPSFTGWVANYASLDSTHKGYWNTKALSVGLSSYVDASGATHTAGEQLFLIAKYAFGTLAYAGFTTTPDAADNAQVLLFSDYAHLTV